MLYSFCILVSAAVLDFGLLRWQAAGTAGRVLPAAAWSMTIGALGLLGLNGALCGGLPTAAYLIGLGIGSAAAAKFAQLREHPHT